MRSTLLFLFLGATLVGLSSLTAPVQSPLPPLDLRLRIRWIKNHPNETFQHFRTGIIWSASYLGATWPQGAFEAAIQEEEPGLYTFDLGRIGLPDAAKAPLGTLLDSLRHTEEYERQCGIDVGRLWLLTVHSSWHYYALTGADARLDDFRQRYQVAQDEALVFPAVYSSVAFGNRVVYLPDSVVWPNLGFIAEEGYGRLELDNFAATEYEVLALMPNGQLRYAIYDRTGRLESHTPAVLGQAGKPSKCQWCHESNLQVLYRPTPHVPGYLSAFDFVTRINALQKKITTYRQGLNTAITFDNRSDHVQAELQYIGFMEPSALRLAQEWGLTEDEVRRRLRRLETHRHEEFDYLGDLYNRADVDAYAPFSTPRVPDSVREPSVFEPQWIR